MNQRMFIHPTYPDAIQKLHRVCILFWNIVMIPQKSPCSKTSSGPASCEAGFQHVLQLDKVWTSVLREASWINNNNQETKAFENGRHA
jgi:hypothetical protein